MGGVDHWLQLAAALDRRGITVKIDVNQVIVRIGTGNAPMSIGYDNHLHPRRWHWAYLGRDGTHPIGDFDGAAQAVEEFLRATPGLADTGLLLRMNCMGMTFQQETEEILARATAAGYVPGSPVTPASRPARPHRPGPRREQRSRDRRGNPNAMTPRTGKIPR